MWISIAMLLPMRRVRRWWGWSTSGLVITIDRILSSTSLDNDFSSSSSTHGFTRSMATFIIKTLTMNAAMGSSTLHLSPKNIAPAIPMSVPIDENASLLWCHAFATTAFELRCFPLYTVYWYNISFNTIETAAAINASILGASSTLPLKASTIPVTEFTRIPTPTANSTTPIIAVASVSYLPCP